MNERKDTKKNVEFVIIILLFIIVGLVTYILYDKELIFKENRVAEINESENTDSNDNQDQKDKENSSTEKDREAIVYYKDEFRRKIPKISYCNQYLFKQYNGSIFYATDLTEEDKISTFNSCQGALAVYYDEEKIEYTDDEVYIYDYVLLYSMQGEYDRNTGKDYYYGTSYNRLNLEYDEIELDENKLTKDVIRKYGKLYKYTFKKDNYGLYAYYSTEAVK